MEVDLGALPPGWRWVRVGEISERVSVGYVSSTRAYFCAPGEGVPLVRSQNIRPGRLVLDDIAWVTRAFHDANPKSQLKPGDVLITRVGANAGDVCIVPNGADEMHLSSAVFARPKLEHRKYVELFFRSPLGQYVLKSRIVGSVSERINTRDVEALSVLLPSAAEEAAIAHILGTLDDKVDLNRQMNETLEAIARALFKSWFVDFEPVRAKAEGRDPGLPKPLADLFPARLVDSELGEIPEGWEVKKLGELLELAYGKALKAADRRDGIVPVYGSNGQVGWHDERLVSGPGIVVGRKGNPGIATWVPTDFFPIDTTFYVVPKSNCRSLEFLFHALRIHDLASLGGDSAVPGLNRNLAYMSSQVLPTAPLLVEFDRIASALSRRSSLVNDDSRNVTALRDALLPKLISGELRVKDTEWFFARTT